VKTYQKTVLLAAALASAANAGVNVYGDAVVGLQYTVDSFSAAERDNKFEVVGGAYAAGNSHINFAASEAGKSGKGAYALAQVNIDLAGQNLEADSFNTGQSYIGYKFDKLDLRMGKMHSLVYDYVGSMNQFGHFGNDIAVFDAMRGHTITTTFDDKVAILAPTYMRNATPGVLRASTKVGPAEVSADVVLTFNGGREWDFAEIGTKFSLQKVDLSIVHQSSNDDVSTTAWDVRDTTAVGAKYKMSNMTSERMLKDVELMATYASYSKDPANNGESSAYSVGAKFNNTSVLYQTSQAKDQARVNLAHVMPVSKSTEFGLEGQIPVSKPYINENSGAPSSTTKMNDESFVTAYIAYKF
jgi:hypothetical protein